jgi:RAT1-interacting protein
MSSTNIDELLRSIPTNLNPLYSEPRELAHFSVDSVGKMSLDRQALYLFRQPQLPCDLNEGLEQYLKDSTTVAPVSSDVERLANDDRRLTQLLLNGKETISAECKHYVDNADIISYRHNFNKIMKTPYDSSHSWQVKFSLRPTTLPRETTTTTTTTTMTASSDKRDNSNDQRQQKRTLVFEMVHSSTHSSPDNNNIDSQKASYWGRRFEEICAVPMVVPSSSSSLSFTDKIDISKKQQMERPFYCSVNHIRFNQEFNLVLASEIDCFISPDTTTSSTTLSSSITPTRKDYCELKTCKELHDERTRRNFLRYKLLTFWIQSFLGGVPRIVVGYRDDRRGALVRMETLVTQKLPRMAGQAWDAWRCLRFTLALLRWVRQFMDERRRTRGEREVEQEKFVLKFIAEKQQLVIEKLEQTNASTLTTASNYASVDDNRHKYPNLN